MSDMQHNQNHLPDAENDNPNNGLAQNQIVNFSPPTHTDADALTDIRLTDGTQIPPTRAPRPQNSYTPRQMAFAGMLIDGYSPKETAIALGYLWERGLLALLMRRKWIEPCKAFVRAKRLAGDRSQMRDVLSSIAHASPADVARIAAKPPEAWTDEEMAKLKGVAEVQAEHTTYPDGRKVSRIKIRMADQVRAAAALDAIHRQDTEAQRLIDQPKPKRARKPVPPKPKAQAPAAPQRMTKKALREKVQSDEIAAIAEVSNPDVSAAIKALLHKPNAATLERLDPIARAIQEGQAQGALPHQTSPASRPAARTTSGEPDGPGPIASPGGSFHFSKEEKVQPPPMREEETIAPVTSISSSDPIQHPDLPECRFWVRSDDGQGMLRNAAENEGNSDRMLVKVYERNEEFLGPIDRSDPRGDVGGGERGLGPISGFDRSTLTHGSEKKPVSLREDADSSAKSEIISRGTKVTVPVVNSFTDLEDGAI